MAVATRHAVSTMLPLSLLRLLVCAVAIVGHQDQQVAGNADAKRLYDDLINGYNSLIRPVGNNSDRLTVKMGLKLSQLMDVVSTWRPSSF